MGQPSVFLVLPTRGKFDPGVLDATHNMGSGFTVADMIWHQCSLINQCFNALLCRAYNYHRGKPFDYWVMLHDDIWPQASWIEILLRELLANGADVVSAVSPVKDDTGQVSNAVITEGEMRRLCVKECLNLPKTFDAKAAGAQHLLVNSGCWIWKFDRAIVRRFALEHAFCSKDFIRELPDGDLEAKSHGEDYGFSAWAAENGLKVFATTAVALAHRGTYDYPNNVPWGTWEKDPTTTRWEWERPVQATLAKIDKQIYETSQELEAAKMTIQRCEGAIVALHQLRQQMQEDDPVVSRIAETNGVPA